MMKRIRKAVIFLALPAAIIWAVMNSGGTPKPSADSIPKPVAAVNQSIAPVQAIANAIDYDKYDELDWGRDPFRSNIKSVAKPATGPVWKLSGVVYNQTDPRAIINNRSLRKGDVVDGAQIVDIKKKSVILRYKGKNHTIEVTKG